MMRPKLYSAWGAIFISRPGTKKKTAAGVETICQPKSGSPEKAKAVNVLTPPTAL
jgi:hypothetical protein